VLDALFGIVQDVAADPKARRKAALKIAEFLLPKIGKKAKVLTDDYGFTVNPQLARKYRDIRRELWSLERGQTRKIPAVAQKIQKLTACADAILRRVQVPCPSKYSSGRWTRDHERLVEYIEMRGKNTVLTEAQDAEEAHLRVRFDVFARGPEHAARGRLNTLRNAEQRFRMNEFFEDYSRAVPLSRADQYDLELLRLLYPDRSRLSELDLEEALRSHPFQMEEPAADGNLYPRKIKNADGAKKQAMAVLEELERLGFQEYMDERTTTKELRA
jgi:hypothetical protein